MTTCAVTALQSALALLLLPRLSAKEPDLTVYLAKKIPSKAANDRWHIHLCMVGWNSVIIAKLILHALSLFSCTLLYALIKLMDIMKL